MDGFRPEDSYGTCLVVSPDPKPLFDDFAAGLRARYGRLPLAGFPRITRPRRRKNVDGFTGFSLVDPGGNWIRVTAAQPDDDGEPRRRPARLARALADAVVLGDSHGDVDQAAKILAGAVRRHSDDAPPASGSRRSPTSSSWLSAATIPPAPARCWRASTPSTCPRGPDRGGRRARVRHRAPHRVRGSRRRPAAPLAFARGGSTRRYGDAALPDPIQLHPGDVGEARSPTRRTAGRPPASTSNPSAGSCTGSGTPSGRTTA